MTHWLDHGKKQRRSSGLTQQQQKKNIDICARALTHITTTSKCSTSKRLGIFQFDSDLVGRKYDEFDLRNSATAMLCSLIVHSHTWTRENTQFAIPHIYKYIYILLSVSTHAIIGVVSRPAGYK